MYQAMKAENANPSISVKIRKLFPGSIRGSSQRETIIARCNDVMSLQVTGLRAMCSKRSAYDDDTKTPSSDPGRGVCRLECRAETQARSGRRDSSGSTKLSSLSAFTLSSSHWLAFAWRNLRPIARRFEQTEKWGGAPLRSRRHRPRCRARQTARWREPGLRFANRRYRVEEFLLR